MRAVPPFGGMEIVERIGSTSDLCRERAAAGAADGFAVLAREQTAGRGSRGRGWVSVAGNLHLSVLLHELAPLAEAGGYALLAGLALIEALDPLRPAAATLTLKWPNDVLCNGGKLGGVLIETAADPSGRLAWLVLGFGANLRVAPELPDRPSVALGATLAPEQVAASVLERLAHWRARRRREGWLAVQAAWSARAHPPGTPLTVAAAGERVSGAFAGLAPDGTLLLATPGGTRRFSTGEVLLGTTLTNEAGHAACR